MTVTTQTTRHRVALIPGDGTGPEVCKAVLRLIAAAGVDIDWAEVPCGRAAHDATGTPLPAGTVAVIRELGVALKGKLETPVGAGYESPNVQLRKALGLFAAVRPIRSQPGTSSRYQGVDLTIVRESTEDVYAGIEHQVVPGVVQSIKITTRAACERIVRHAFAVARREQKGKVTLVHKANIMKKADGLFLKTAKDVAADYPDIVCDEVIVDALCMHLTMRPDRFDVLVCGNLFGDIVADVVAGLVGGTANCPSINVAPGVRVFTAGHGDPPEWTGTGQANPMSLLFSAVLMLRSWGDHEAADRVYGAIAATLRDGVHPVAIGGSAGCTAFTDGVIARL